MRNSLLFLFVLILTACAGMVLRTPPESNPGNSSIDSSDNWRVEGELSPYGYPEIKQLMVKLVDVDTHEPITSRCVLLNISLPGGHLCNIEYAEEYGRKGYPNAYGKLGVAVDSEVSDYGYLAELPLPDGYQFATAPEHTLSALDLREMNDLVLFYRKRPTLNVTLREKNGNKVEDAGWYAIPTKPDAAMMNYSVHRQNGFGYAEPVEPFVTEYLSNPLNGNDLSVFARDFLFTASSGRPFCNLNHGLSYGSSNFTIDSLYTGEWEFVVFTGPENKVHIPMILTPGDNKLEVIVENTPYMNVTVICKGEMSKYVDDYRREYLYSAQIRDTQEDPRLKNVWDSENNVSHWIGDTLTLNLRLPYNSKWELVVDDTLLTFDSIIGTHSTFELEWETVLLTVDRFIWDNLDNPSFELIDQRQESDDVVLFDETGWKDDRVVFKLKLPVGSYNYRFGKFSGNIRLEARNSIELDFTLMHCTDLARLVITDPNKLVPNKPTFVPSVVEDKDEENWPKPANASATENHNPSATNPICFENQDGTWTCFALAGTYFVRVGNSTIPCTLPGELSISDKLLNEYEDSEFLVYIDGSSVVWKYFLRHENGAAIAFDSENNLPRGKYSLLIIDEYFLDELRYTVLEFEVTKKLELNVVYFEWKPLRKVRLELHGLGDTLNGHFGGELTIVNIDRGFTQKIKAQHWLPLVPPETIEIWLPIGRYEISRWPEHNNPEEFEVDLAEHLTIEIDS